MTSPPPENCPHCKSAAEELLRRHASGQAEDNIRSAVRDFLRETGLMTPGEMESEAHPAPGSNRAVDLVAEALIEVKQRIGGPGGGLKPLAEHVRQLDGYLEEAHSAGRTGRMGVLTDGKHWVLRYKGASAEPSLVHPYAFTLDSPDRWIGLYEWLRNNALITYKNEYPDPEAIRQHFSATSAAYERETAGLRLIRDEVRQSPAFLTKRNLWETLLKTALGELGESDEDLDELFIQHTYLSIIVALIVQARFGIDIRLVGETDPADLLKGQRFRDDTGIQGIVESDFFAWPAEFGGESLLRDIARRAARFDWLQAPSNAGALLYESVIPADQRRRLGEYYTPHWLAKAIIEETVDKPLEQRVLDPACGSGTFIAVAVEHFLTVARRAKLGPQETLQRLLEAIVGVDVHPVAVHLARAAWVIAAKPAIQAVVASGSSASIAVPVYLGDSLLLRFPGLRVGDMISETEVRISVDDNPANDLVFPRSLVDRAGDFDGLMTAAARAIEAGDDPAALIDEYDVRPGEHSVVEEALATMQRLHDEGRNHIWAYYTRNLVRPLLLSRNRVDVIVGNPPWITYNKTIGVLRDQLVRRSKEEYNLWAGGRYATHQDVAGLFYTRCVDLYLNDEGVIGMVMPHSALQAGQYTKWRTAEWKSTMGGRGFTRVLAVRFSWKPPWDLEQLKPNSFFPVPASVVFARRVGVDGKGSPLAGEALQWRGSAGASNVQRAPVRITDTSAGGISPYAGYSTQGATIVPRRLFFVEEIESQTLVQTLPLVTVRPRLSKLDKKPWNDINLDAITGVPVEREHLFNVHLGETVAPYVLLPPLRALLPLKHGELALPFADESNPHGVGGIDVRSLGERMQSRWRAISGLWEEHKATANNLNLAGQLDYYGKFSAQLQWRRDRGNRPVRIAYTSAGRPTAALLDGDASFIESKLFWVTCRNLQEAHYLLAIINSNALEIAVAPLMSKGLFGARDLQKHLWRLPIPEFDPANKLHTAIADAAAAVEQGAADVYRELCAEAAAQTEPQPVTVTLARRALRRWLAASDEGRAVENAVGRLLRSPR